MIGSCFFGCNKAQQVWQSAGLWQLICNEFEVAEGASELILKLLNVLDQNSKSNFVAVLWCLWRKRNDVVWNSTEKPVNLALHDARLLASDLLQHHSPKHQRRSDMETQ